MPPILDTAIGTVFVFLLFSLVVSALNEYILSLTDQRAKFLRMGLAEMFGQKAASLGGLARVWNLISGGLWRGNAAVGAQGNALLDHGLINAFSRSDGGTSPSYIPAGAFVTALLDNVVGRGSPVVRDATQISQAKSLLTELQVILPASGANVNPISFVSALTNFDVNYRALATPPQAGSPLARLHAQVVSAQARASTQGATAIDSSRNALEVAAAITVATLAHATVLNAAKAIEAGILNLNNDPLLRDSLLSLFRAVDGDVQKFRLAVEGWFNGVMDRVSGWYKRFAQKWMIAFGFILAAIFHVDTIEIVRVLSNNPNLAKAVADGAQAYAVEANRPLSPEDLAKRRNEQLDAVVKASGKLQELKSKPGTAEEIAVAEEEVVAATAKANPLSSYQTALAKLKDTGLPIGWNEDRWKLFSEGRAAAKFSIIAGWFLTALAGSLGAPFWFDLLGRFINVRAAGKAPGEKETTSTPTRPAPANIDSTPGVR